VARALTAALGLAMAQGGLVLDIHATTDVRELTLASIECGRCVRVRTGGVDALALANLDPAPRGWCPN